MKDVFSYEEIGERFDKLCFALGSSKLRVVLVNNPINVANFLKKSVKNGSKKLSIIIRICTMEKKDKEEKISLNLKRFWKLDEKKTRKSTEKFKPLIKYNNGLNFALHVQMKFRGKRWGFRKKIWKLDEKSEKRYLPSRNRKHYLNWKTSLMRVTPPNFWRIFFLIKKFYSFKFLKWLFYLPPA